MIIFFLLADFFTYYLTQYVLFINSMIKKANTKSLCNMFL